MRIEMKKILPLIVLASLQACTYVELTPAGKEIMLIDSSKAESCKKLGQTRVALNLKAASGFTKHDEVVIDLERTARNTAPRLNGNAVTPIDEIEDGKQTFSIYECP